MSEQAVANLLMTFGVDEIERATLIAENVAAVTGHEPLLVAKALGRFLCAPSFGPAGLERLVGPLPPWTDPSDVLDYLMVRFYVGAEGGDR